MSGDPVGVLDWGHVVARPAPGLDELAARVDDSIVKITDFVHQVVHSRDFAVRVWRNWVLEDPFEHPCG